MTPDKRAPTDFPLIVDAHCHLGPFRNFHIPENSIDGFVATMDSLGTDVAVVASHMAISSDTPRGNAAVAAAIARYPERILGHCTVNPNYPDEVTAELERCFADPGFRSIKVHPELHGHYPLDGARYRPMWAFAAERSLPVLAHSHFAGDSLAVFGRLADDYPTVALLLGHAGFDLGLEPVVQLVGRHANVVLDLTGPLFFDGLVEFLVREVGAERLLYGSDSPFVNPALQLGGVVCAQISRTDQEQILSGTADRLFGVSERLASVRADRSGANP